MLVYPYPPPPPIKHKPTEPFTNTHNSNDKIA